MLQLNPQEVNRLKQLMAAGTLTPDMLEGADIRGPDGQNALAPMLSRQLPIGSMRNESTGAMTYFQPDPNAPRTQQDPGFSDRPYPAMPASAQQRPKMRVIGYGNGQATDLGEEDARAMPVDYTRAAVDIPGVGKGRYTADGRSAIVTNPDGSQTKVILGYDAEGSDRLNARALARQKVEADIRQTEESIAASRDARTRKESPEIVPGAGYAQALLEKQYGKAPDGFRWNAAGALEKIPGSEAAGGKMTEFQGKSSAFGQRAANAHEILNAVGQDGKVQPNLLKRGLESIPLIGGALGLGANTIPSGLGGPSAEQQQVEQAQRDFVNATLRQESGAVISPTEFENAQQQYFPQPGDSPEVVAQKKKNREIVVSSFADSAGPAKAQVLKSGGKARALFDAKSAIRRGAPRAAVLQRLQSMGIDPGEL